MYVPIHRHKVSWADRTMSILRASRFQACGKDLAGLPSLCLFDGSLTDREAETLFHMSFFADERPMKELHTLDGLRVDVMNSFPAEMALLSPDEHELMLRAVLLGGRAPLFNADFVYAARSLIRRLWGTLERSGHISFLKIPIQVSMAALLTMGNDEHHRVRDKMDKIFDTVDNTLYLTGILSVKTVLRDMLRAMEGTIAENRPDLCVRTLRTGFETFYGPDGELMLAHPGLADPFELALEQQRAVSCAVPSLDVLEDAGSSLPTLEDPLYDRLFGLIQGLCRPESSEEDTVEDLIMLAKQGAGVTDLREVLSSRIIRLPTPEMLFVLDEMERRIPRWGSLSMGQVQ